MPLVLFAQPRFPTGVVVMTPGVEDLALQGQFNPATYLRRHLNAEWGDLNEGDRHLNDAALASGQDRLFSSYQIAADLTLWIITEWDRSVTTLLLPNEY